MKRLYIHGICKQDGSNYYIGGENLYESVFDFVESNYYGIGGAKCDCGGYYGLGSQNMTLSHCNIRMYVTKQQSTLDEAMSSLLNFMEGYLEGEADYYGYSEYTIMGLDIDKFCIGGHDIRNELHQYKGKYVHFILEF